MQKIKSTKYYIIQTYNFLIRCISGLCFGKMNRKQFRAKYTLLKKGYTNSPYFENKNIGKIYYPIYLKMNVLPKNYGNIYNKEGLPLKVFFIRGEIIPLPEVSKYFMLNRYNYNLDVHIYTHKAALEVIGKPKKCYALFGEPRAITPETYNIFNHNKGLEKDFDLIFTHDTELLNKFDNARLFNPFAHLWGKIDNTTGNLEDILQYKTKKCSILASDKLYCPLHKLRYDIAWKCKNYNLADTYGTFDGGSLVPFDDTLKNYMYSIVIENEIDDYWFTEKILNCFSHLCIPIYVGARKIDTIFNGDGIIQVTPKDFDNIEQVLKQCTKEEYLSRINAVYENYYKSLEYSSSADLLYEKYIKYDLNKGKK